MSRADEILAKRLNAVLGPVLRSPLPENAILADVFTVKILRPIELCVQESFCASKQKEVEGLARSRLWYKASLSSLSPDANVLDGRFIYTIKNYGTPSEMAKVRYVAQGYGDQEKPHMVHETSSLRASSTRPILSVAACLQFRVWSHDVHKAYLQSKHRMTRDVCIRPKPADGDLF